MCLARRDRCQLQCFTAFHRVPQWGSWRSFIYSQQRDRREQFCQRYKWGIHMRRQQSASTKGQTPNFTPSAFCCYLWETKVTQWALRWEQNTCSLLCGVRGSSCHLSPISNGLVIVSFQSFSNAGDFSSCTHCSDFKPHLLNYLIDQPIFLILKMYFLLL